MNPKAEIDGNMMSCDFLYSGNITVMVLPLEQCHHAACKQHDAYLHTHRITDIPTTFVE